MPLQEKKLRLLALSLLVAGVSTVHAANVTSTEGPGSLREVLSTTDEAVVNLAVDSPIVITGGAIDPSSNVTTLSGKHEEGKGLDGLAEGLIEAASQFISTAPTLPSLKDYFASDGDYMGLVDTAIEEALPDASVIKGSDDEYTYTEFYRPAKGDDIKGETRTHNMFSPPISDKSGGIGYENVAFMNFNVLLGRGYPTNGSGMTECLQNMSYCGGGVVGGNTRTGFSDPVSIGDITNNLFIGNILGITSGAGYYGGGVVGVLSGYASIGDITNNLFIGNTVTARGFVGGGVVGAASYDFTASDGYRCNCNDAFASIGDITNSLFIGNTVTTGGSIASKGFTGGGVVGVYSYLSDSYYSYDSYSSFVSIGDITNSFFIGNTVTVTGSGKDFWGLEGGGVLGVFSKAFSSSLGDIKSSFFVGNGIQVINLDSTNNNAKLWGGLIYTGDDLTIENSVFTGNTFAVDDIVNFLGTVSIDTSKTGFVIDGEGAGTDDNDPDTHTVTLRASDGQTTLFRSNLTKKTGADCELPPSDCTSNSIAFRNIKLIDNNFDRRTTSAVNAVLNIVTSDPGEGSGTVALYDPIWVELDNDKTFTMTVSGEGEFLWGGVNTVTVNSGLDNDDNRITLNGDITLLEGFALDAPRHTLRINQGVTLTDDTDNRITVGVFSVDVEASKELTYRGKITGAGSLTKSGTGTLILNASDNAAGTVTVEKGKFIVGGSSSYNAQLTATSGITGVQVSSGALLGGYGTIVGNVTIGDDGILSPGNSPGTLKVIGDVTFNETSHFNVNYQDLLDITGKAYLNGTVYHESDPGDTVAGYILISEMLILKASEGYEGRFEEDVITDLAGLSAKVEHRDEGKVYVVFSGDGSGSDNGDNDNGDNGDNDNGNGGDNGNNGNGNGGDNDNDNGDNGNGDNDNVSGEAHASLKGMLLTRDDNFLRRLRRHVSVRSSPGNDTGNGIWMGVNRNTMALGGNGQTARARWSGTELFGGHDARFANGWLGGMAFRLEEGRQEVDDRHSEAEVISGTAALYGGRELPAGSGTLRVLFAGALSQHDVESERSERYVESSPWAALIQRYVQIGARDQRLKTHYHGRTSNASLEAAWRVSSANEALSMEPYAALTWQRLSLDGFTERGGSAALEKGKESETQTRSTLGLRFSTSPKARLSFDVDVGWQHLYGNATQKSAFTFKEGGSGKFTTLGAPLNKDAALLGISLGARINNSTRLSLQYDGELGDRGQSHGGQVVLEVRW